MAVESSGKSAGFEVIVSRSVHCAGTTGFVKGYSFGSSAVSGSLVNPLSLYKKRS